MNGVKYHRLKLGMKCTTLANNAGISIGTVKNLEKANKPGGISAVYYCQVSEVLHVTVGELMKNNYPDPGKDVSHRAPYPSRTANKRNPIFIYRRTKNMSCQQLAACLGLKTRERARQLCSMEIPLEKHLEKLANLENLSVEEFKNKYSFRGN